jgi:hypothetical protein
MTGKEPDYTGFIRVRFNSRVLIAFQGQNTASMPTITNSVEYISLKHNVDKILYKDSNGVWTGWASKIGFKEFTIDSDESGNITDQLLKRFLLWVRMQELKKFGGSNTLVRTVK